MSDPVTVAEFRKDLTEFASGERYPNAVIKFWLDFAYLSTNIHRWGSWRPMGVKMFVAHQVSLERQAMDESDTGAVPGISTGMINNKSVDKVSVGYDTQGGSELDAGHWNLTIYGKRYVHMARMIGAGPIQVGIGCMPGPLSSANAWAGIWTSNFPNPSDSG